MAEENNDGQQAGNGDGNGFTPITSQDELNKVIGQRIAKVESKFADYEDMKAKADKFDEAEEANKSEIQKAQDAARAAEERATQAEQAALRADVAAAKGVPASALTGTTKKELEASADALIQWRGEQKKPAPGVGGLKSGSAGEDTSGMSAKERAAAAIRGMSGN